MNFTPCDVIYVDRTVGRERAVASAAEDVLEAQEWETASIKENVRLLLMTFDEGTAFLHSTAEEGLWLMHTDRLDHCSLPVRNRRILRLSID